jgi:L,D-transpeptidase YcbB
MSNTSLKIAASIVALAFAASTADAEVRKPQRKSFFERLFSAPKVKKQKNQQRKTIFSWSSQDDEVNIVYGNERRARRTYVDPEPLPTLGMGNRDYVETKRVLVFDSVAAKAQGSTPEAEAIRQQLASKSTDLRAVQKDRDAIIAHYKQTGFKPLWISGGKLTERGTQLLTTLEKAAEHGLSPDRYKTATLQEKARSLDTGLAGELDVALTIAALEYARELNSGQFEPNRLSAYHDLTPENLAPETILRVLAYSPFPQNYLDSLAPSNAEYVLLKDELKKVENDITTKPFEPFEMTGKRVKAGQSDSRIPDLRERMLELGHIEPGEALIAEGDRDILDKALSVALKSFQKSNGIKATGSLDKSTELVLNTDARKRQRDKLLVNMERIRWLPKDLGQRHVFVNQAGFEVVVRDNGAEAWRSKVIVGKPMTQTYVFNDIMETVVFNPSWGVPQSIIVNEYMPKLRRDPGYLDK